MLSLEELKQWIHRDLGQSDKLLLILAALGKPSAISEIKEMGSRAGFRIPVKWNPSLALGRTKGKAIKVPEGWELTDLGKAHLRTLGVSTISPAAVQVAVDLRRHLANITNPDTAKFVEEAIKCHEAQLYRSAIVMSWIAAVDVLYREVVANHLDAFNQEAARIDPRWRIAMNADDLARMKESDFLDRVVSISVIGKSVKDALKECLTRRNGCGHPNSFKTGALQASAHIETLSLNVFEVFVV